MEDCVEHSILSSHKFAVAGLRMEVEREHHVALQQQRLIRLISIALNIEDSSSVITSNWINNRPVAASSL